MSPQPPVIQLPLIAPFAPAQLAPMFAPLDATVAAVNQVASSLAAGLGTLLTAPLALLTPRPGSPQAVPLLAPLEAGRAAIKQVIAAAPAPPGVPAAAAPTGELARTFVIGS